MSKLPKNAATWFFIPATDFAKSVKFFEDLLEISLIEETEGEGEQALTYAMFPKQGKDGMTGAVAPAVITQPANGGVFLYLHCADIDGALSRVDRLGGSILSPKRPLPGEMGLVATVADLDGTPIGLHQP
nr:VOC family protein [uncultured Cohaesibacter sp.]